MSKYSFVMFITMVRAPLTLVGAALMVAHCFFPSPAMLATAIGLMIVGALTDLFDGHLARKWRVTSRLGALADPLMDKVFYAVTLPVAVFVAAWFEDYRHATLILALDVVSALRDQWVSFLRSVGSEYGADVKANWSGKLRTLVGFPVIVFVHLQLGLEVLRMHSPAHESVAVFPPRELVFALETALMALTLLSAFSYTARYAPYLKKASRQK